MAQQHFSRRQFLRVGAGTVVVVSFGACASADRADRPIGPVDPRSRPPLPSSSLPALGMSTSTTSTAPMGELLAGRRLVIVQMNGGNDGLNTVVPLDGRYHDARPTLGLDDGSLVGLDGIDDVALHPSLAPLVPFWADGRLAVVRGIGFDRPNRSHFVAMDRWWRADDLAGTGWLGRVLDSLPADPAALHSTALGGGAPLLSGVVRQPTTVASPSSFKFAGLDPEVVRLLAAPEANDTVTALAQRAFARTVDAVADFAEITGADPAAEDLPDREGDASISAGLAVAAQLLGGDVGAQVVVVSASGFDTHANQVAVQRDLLGDLAAGIASFFAQIEQDGLRDDVLLVTTSEFGRRVHENGSGGTDHGAGGVSFALGQGVRGGVYGAADLGDLLDGDIRPTVDPRVLYTACLDWLGADPSAVLGRRYDEVNLLRV